MINEFIPYQEALALKELGFDDPCLAYYYVDIKSPPKLKPVDTDFINYRSIGEPSIKAPMFDQALNWFRLIYGLDISILRTKEKVNGEWKRTEYYMYSICNDEQLPLELSFELMDNASYIDARLACLKKLIKINKK